MATQTPPLRPPAPAPLPSGGGLDERETAPFEPLQAPRRDAFELLDHRSRARAIPAGKALPGHYLGLDDDDGETWLIPINDRVMHVGRAIGAALRFDDARVSRRHAIVVRYGRQVRVLDDRSAAGTFVNGARVVATTLEDRDVVRLGPASFTYTIVR
jgi:pSer/pThr/pTyr-binding forkhead associated (FHA) protein